MEQDQAIIEGLAEGEGYMFWPKWKAVSPKNRRVQEKHGRKNEKADATEYATSRISKEGPKINEGLQIYFGSAAFISADGDTSTSRGINYDFIKPEEHGIQEINVLTDYPSFILQFTDENLHIIRQISNQKNIVLKNIKPGNYRIRVLIDANNDGIWSPGNMKKHIEPEPVFIYSEVLVIRADWRTTLDLTF